MSEQSYNCPECKDTGVYQGLLAVEPCRACGGNAGNVTLASRPQMQPLFRTSEMIQDVIPALMNPHYISQYCQQFSGGQSIRHEIEEQAAEPKSVSLSQEQLKAIAKDHPPSQWWHGGEFCVPILVDGGIGCVSLPFDEIMPADLEGIKEGDSVNVEIHCQEWTRVFGIFDSIIDRPLFGLPSRSFRFVSFASKPNGEGQNPTITGTLLYKPLSESDTLRIKNSAGESVWCQLLYTLDPCSDVLFVPIVED